MDPASKRLLVIVIVLIIAMEAAFRLVRPVTPFAERELAARTHEAAGELDQAEQQWREAADDRPRSARAWSALGDFLRTRRGDGGGAEAAYDKALACPAPVNDDEQRSRAAQHQLGRALAWHGRGALLLARGHRAAGMNCLAQAADTVRLPATHRLLARAKAAAGDLAGATAEVQRALELTPEDPAVRWEVAALLQRSGKADLARRVLPTGEPATADALLAAARWRAALGDAAGSAALVGRWRAARDRAVDEDPAQDALLVPPARPAAATPPAASATAAAVTPPML